MAAIHIIKYINSLTWNDMRLFLQNLMPYRKLNNGMIWSCFKSLSDMSLCTKEFFFLTGLVKPGGTDAISEQKGKHPPAPNFLRTGNVQQRITLLIPKSAMEAYVLRRLQWHLLKTSQC